MKHFTKLLCTAIIVYSSALSFAGNRPYVYIPGDHFPTSFRMDPRVKEGDYIPNKIIFKVKQQYRQNCKVNSIDNILRLQDLLNAVGAQNFGKIYPNHRAPDHEFNEVGLRLADLSLIYSFTYTSNSLSLEKTINEFLALGYFEFVEPWYVPKVMYVPTEGSTYASQYHLKGNVPGSVDTQGAWTITKGSASVVIGVVDQGTQKAHPDLAANYIGGYDVGMNDADPEYSGTYTHGVFTSGDACEVTDNGVGGAGPGFNCKFKAIKISEDAGGTLIAGYQGITWAADNGCKIINCSWGGPGGGAYGQTVCDYATINKNCLMCVSAGNGSVEEFLYPSSYIGVYRVASTTSSDAKSGFSSYGVDVDYGSPGTQIYSTTPGSYGPVDGTSMASPVSAGVAGLIQSQWNYANAFQIGERMKQTCDPYVGGSTLTLFNAGKLGKGRIDANRAVTASVTAKSISMNPINITDGNDNVFMPSETITISGSFINYLDPSTSAAAAVLTVVSGPGTIVNGNCAIGAMATLATQTVTTPFTVSIQAGAAVNSKISFKVTCTDGTFSGSQYFDVTVNPDYINIINNDVHTSITSKGRIGYNLDQTQQGLGFEYQVPSPAKQTLYEMSLMVGTSATAVSDMFREAGTGNSDFTSSQRVYQVSPAVVSDFDVDGKFTDATSPSPIPVQVRHSAFAWSTAPYRRFVIVKYVIKNTGATALSNTAVGVVADFDIVNAAANKGGWDASTNMAYAYEVAAGGIYAGIKLLGCKTSGGTAIGTPNGYILDLVAGGNGGVDAGTDYLTAEKYTTLTTSRTADGYTATGGDVMALTSSYGLSIPAGDSIIVAFALIAGDNLADMQLSACHAQNKYDGTSNPCVVDVNNIENENFWMYNYPNPSSSSFNIDYNLDGNNAGTIRIMNSLGEVVMTLNNLLPGAHTLKVDASKLSAGNYFYQMRSGEAVLTKKLTIVK
jgi:hypothetical protein